MNIYCDNKTTIDLSNNPILYDHIKYVEIDQHFVNDKIHSKEPILPYIETQDQLETQDQMADVFIKRSFSSDFERNIGKLGKGSDDVCDRVGWPRPTRPALG